MTLAQSLTSGDKPGNRIIGQSAGADDPSSLEAGGTVGGNEGMRAGLICPAPGMHSLREDYLA